MHHHVSLKTAVLGLALLLSTQALAEETKEPEVGKYGTVLRGRGEGVLITVEMVRIGPKADKEVIMRITGIDDPIDYVVKKYKKQHAGGGFDYVDDKDYHRLIERKRGGYNAYELFAGGKTYMLAPDPAGQREFRPLHLRTEYLAQARGEVTNTQKRMQVFLDSKDGRPEMSRYGLALRGRGTHSNVVVHLARIGPKKDRTFLLRFSGIDTELDGAVRKVKVRPWGNGGAKYMDGESNRLGARKSYGVMSYELYVDNESIPVDVDEYQTRDLKTQHFLTAHLQQEEAAKGKKAKRKSKK